MDKNKYLHDTYDVIKVRVLKGEAEKIKRVATEDGETVNEFINRLILNQIPDFKPIGKRGRKEK